MDDDIRRLRALLADARCAIALTGAGISTDSGIPDFRSRTGIWAAFDPLEVGHIDAFRRDPARVWEFYRLRVDALRAARPNAGHAALAALEADGRLRRVVTQNVDGLHRAAGSDALEVHGALDRAVCPRCDATVPIGDALAGPGVPACRCGATLKPGVVLFGEPLPEAAIDEAFALTSSCDVLLAAGSSLTVHPVAGLPRVARRAGATIAIVNAGETGCDDVADIRIDAPLGAVLPLLV